MLCSLNFLVKIIHVVIELLLVFQQNSNVSCNPKCSFKTAEAQNTGVLYDLIAYRHFSLALAHDHILRFNNEAYNKNNRNID